MMDEESAMQRSWEKHFRQREQQTPRSKGGTSLQLKRQRPRGQSVRRVDGEEGGA